MDITSIGIILVDMFPSQVGMPLVEVPAFMPMPGGAPANVAVAAQRLGSSTAFIGKVGQDLFGQWLKNILDREGVNTQGMVFDDYARTSLVFIGMPDAHKAEFLFYRNPGADMRLRKEDLSLQLLERTKVLHFDSLSLTHDTYRDATLNAIETVKKHGGIISYDVNYRPTMWNSPDSAIKAAQDILEFCDVIKVNETEMRLLTGENGYVSGGQALLKRAGKLCLITLGDIGSYYITHYKFGFIPAYKVNTIDSIGCGDSFLGAVLNQITQYDSLDKAIHPDNIENILRFASAAGALTSLARGALPALPYKNDVLTFLSALQE